MNTKTKFKTFFDSKQEPEVYVNKYEEHNDFFNNLIQNGHKEDIEYVLQIKLYKYADSLFKTGNYSKALTITHQIEKELEKIKGQSKWHDLYLEAVVFNKGINLGRLKKYKDSNKEFEKLLKQNPTNDNFIDWYKSNKKSEIGQTMDKITAVAVGFYVLIVIAEILGYKVENIIIREIGLAVGLGSFVLSYILKKLIDKQKFEFK